MYVLIVDDDAPTVDAIHDGIDWAALGVKTVDAAYDCAEAEEKIRRQAPDVILCDIEMPRGSGLDLLRWLREQGMECEFIFLTCHASYDYAKLAIQYQASDYVTKPFNAQNVENTLRRAISRVRYRRRLMEQSASGARWQDERSLAQESFWRALVFTGTQMPLPELSDRLQELEIPPAPGGYVLVLTAVPQSRVDESWQPELFQYALQNLMMELLDGTDHTRVFAYHRNQSFYCLALVQADKDKAALHACCKKLCDACGSHLQAEATCYLSQPVALDGLAAARKMLEERDKENIVNRGGVVAGDNTTVSDQAPPYQLDAEKIGLLFRQERGMEIINLIRDDLQKQANQHRLDAERLNLIHQDFLQILYTVLYGENIQAHELFRDGATVRLDRAATLSLFDMMKWVVFVVNRTISCIRQSRQSQSVAGKIEQEIQQHYAEGITRDEVAAAVYLTPDYANRLFKEEKGISIKDYLNQYRINKAKQLLLQKNVNVSNVAGLVGIDNFSYFSTLFKKYTGCSPSEYRKNTPRD